MNTVTRLKQKGIVVVLLVFAWIPISDAATNAPSTEKAVNTLLTAIAVNNYDALIANAAPALKARITKEMFTQVSTQLSSRLKNGYKLQYSAASNNKGSRSFCGR
ncbi:MAG: hypothetical protein EHM27_11600 [Deltaproteobacteria bacterium]|nr:MAG: hypothetical protein EHM27_11600 [Deltaproteobacteria bacterium]